MDPCSPSTDSRTRRRCVWGCDCVPEGGGGEMASKRTWFCFLQRGCVFLVFLCLLSTRGISRAPVLHEPLPCMPTCAEVFILLLLVRKLVVVVIPFFPPCHFRPSGNPCCQQHQLGSRRVLLQSEPWPRVACGGGTGCWHGGGERGHSVQRGAARPRRRAENLSTLFAAPPMCFALAARLHSKLHSRFLL